MRKLSLLAIAVGGSMCLASAVHAQAIVVKDAACVLFDGNGSAAVIPDGGHFLVTPSSNGNSNATCSGIVLPAAGGGTVHYDFESTGAVCNTAICLTEDWKEVVTPNGNASITCHCKF
jgi:hypothetical protein